jgi:proliferating cell nuclear antigen
MRPLWTPLNDPEGIPGFPDRWEWITVTKIKCEAGQFKKFIQAIRVMHSESRLYITTDGISLKLVDTANVGMLLLSLKSSAMKGYKFNEKTPELVALDWVNVSKILQATKAQTPLELEFKEKALVISYEEIDGQITYINPADLRKEPNPPTLALSTTFDFDGSLINKFGKTLLGDKLEITVKNKIVECLCEGSDKNHSKILLSRNGNEKDARSLYSWEYFKEFGKVLDKTYVTASFSDDHPITLKATVQGIDIEYLLAPRIEA